MVISLVIATDTEFFVGDGICGKRTVVLSENGGRIRMLSGVLESGKRLKLKGVGD